MKGSTAPRPRRKPPGRYHHGDLRQALLQEAVRTIDTQGAERLTLREVGKKLGVSRTALYRHFADKSALLQAVAREGFRGLRQQLTAAWEGAGHGWKGFEAMGSAYVRFAIERPAHYRVMFGQFVDPSAPDPELEAEASGAFQVLIDSLVELQKEGRVLPADPLQLARYIWALVHGIAMLAIDGRLRGKKGDPETLVRFAQERIRHGIAAKE